MKSMTLKQFIEEYKPYKQNTDRTYRKYFIVNDLKINTLYGLSKYYVCNIFTGEQEDNILKLYPGKKFSLLNSFFIVTENAWMDEDEVLLVDVKNKKEEKKEE